MKKSLLLLVPLVFLTGCLPFMQKTTNSSSSENPADIPISYVKFHYAAIKVSEKQNGYKNALVNGDVRSVKEENIIIYHFDNVRFQGFTDGRLDSSQMASQIIQYINDENKLLAFYLTLTTAEHITEGDDYKYYLNPLRVVFVDEKTQLTSAMGFNEYGLLTQYITLLDNQKTTLTITWYK